MFVKYWKELASLLFFGILSIVILLVGGEFLSDAYVPIVVSVFFTGAMLSWIKLKVKYTADRDTEQLMQKIGQQPTKEQLEGQEKWAGKLELKDKTLIFSCEGAQDLKIVLSDVKVIGEYTTIADPIMVDWLDWYLVIVCKNNEIRWVPTYAVGVQETLAQLSEIFGYEVVTRLHGNLEFDSNVIYPQSMNGEKLFHVEGLETKGLWRKLKSAIGLGTVTITLREEIIELEG